MKVLTKRPVQFSIEFDFDEIRKLHADGLYNPSSFIIPGDTVELWLTSDELSKCVKAIYGKMAEEDLDAMLDSLLTKFN